MYTEEQESVYESPSKKSNKYAVTQDEIDSILINELKDYQFPVRPRYNPRIWSNGLTSGLVYKWGQLKEGSLSIEIGKQDNPTQEFLIDTLLHEYYEAEIMINQYTVDFYNKLSKISSKMRHEWIQAQIEKFFREMENNYELG